MKLGAARQQAPTAWRLVEVELGQAAGTFTLSARSRQAQAGASARRPLPACAPISPKPIRRSSGVLSAARRGGRGVQEPQRRSRHPADLPSGRAAHRSAHLHRLPRLLPARHAGPAVVQPCAGLTPRSVLEKFAAVQMIDVHVPTTDGRELLLTRYTQPERELQLLLETLQARPTGSIDRRKSAPLKPLRRQPCSADLGRCTRDYSTG